MANMFWDEVERVLRERIDWCARCRDNVQSGVDASPLQKEVDTLTHALRCVVAMRWSHEHLGTPDLDDIEAAMAAVGGAGGGG